MRTDWKDVLEMIRLALNEALRLLEDAQQEGEIGIVPARRLRALQRALEDVVQLYRQIED